jgi:two-component system, OmpR family, sensor histidine kinase KdpD
MTGATVRRVYRYPVAVLMVAVVTWPLWLLHASLTWANISLIYVLLILGLAIWLGTGPSLLAAVVSFFASEFFLLKPLYSFAVSDPREFLDLCVYLVVAMLAGQLGAYARRQAHVARRRADEQRLLFSLSSAFNRVADREGVFDTFKQVVAEQLDAREISILPDTSEVIAPGKAPQAISCVLLAVEDSVYGTVRVVFDSTPSAEQSRLLTACVLQAAMALRRIELAEQAQRSLGFEEADRLKTALLHAVSHDLRTPITIIKTSASSLYALHHRLSEEERMEMIETIESETDHLNRMVGNLLDLSRLQAGVLAINKDWNALSDIVGDVAARAWERYRAERIRIVFPADLPLLRFDYGLMLQALGNVVENALRYEPDSSQIEIRGDPLPTEVRLLVVNHGPTIPPAERERIMEPFYHQEHGHVGLGLAISKGIVEAHHGRIWVEDTPGGGATFVLALPRDRLEEVPLEDTGGR